jgi:hypothetical protein
MTNEELPEIIELAKSYGFDRHISKTTNDIYWECDEEDLLKFARELYDEGYTKGFKVGHDAGWELNEEVSRKGL